MKAINVRPQKWLQNENYPIRILYDDGEYSFIWGQFESAGALGARWNGEDGIGYPSLGGNPTWYVEPDFIAISILQRLQIMAIDNNDRQYMDNINFAIRELTDKMRIT